MLGSELRAIREAHGWTPIQVCNALHYCRSACGDWECGRLQVPPGVAAWALALPPVPQSGAYPPTMGGLRAWYVRHDMTCREVAEFVGIAEHTVWRWLSGVSQLPLAVRAWLRAGAPPAWQWAPPGAPANRLSIMGKPRDADAPVRPAPMRRLGSITGRRFRQTAKPRPWRRVEQTA